VQTLPAAQTTPQTPQLPTSMLVSTHLPLQDVACGAHAHVEFVQTCRAMQPAPQAPQLLGSVVVSVHFELQSSWPVGQTQWLA
jgi:hypothetical protein